MIDTANNAVVGTIAVGSSPVTVAITSDGQHAYVTNAGGGTVSVIDTANNTVGATVAVGDVPNGVAITPDGKYVYVTNELSGTVSVIDTANNMGDGNPIQVTFYPTGVAITPLATSAFNIKQLIIDQNRGALFLLSNFTLGKDSNGINPVKENVTLKIADFTMMIPAGSFHKDHYLPLFAFAGQIGNVWVEALITPLGRNRFGFQALAYGAQFRDTTNPVTVGLTIGDDGGTTTANASINETAGHF